MEHLKCCNMYQRWLLILSATYFFLGTVNCMERNKTHDFQVPNYDTIRSCLVNLPNSQCTKDLQRYINALEDQESWAMIMFDSTVKFPFGLLHGNTYQLGNFDECIDVTVPGNKDNSSISPLQGQYCLAQIGVNITETNDSSMHNNFVVNRRKSHPAFFKTHWALCIPSSCSANEAEKFIYELFAKTMPSKQLVVNITNDLCHFKKEFQMTTGQFFYCAIIGGFLLIVIISTSYHCVHVYKKQHCSGYQINRTREEYSLKHELIISLSLFKNIRKLLSIRAKNNDLNLDCICGIRTISMGFILTGHALIFLLSAPALNTGFAVDALKKIQNSIFLNNPLLVDTFLLISGFLMCRLLLIEMEKRMGKVNVFLMYLARYIRLTPSYAVIIGFYCTFLSDLGDGPLWNSKVNLEQKRCIHSWWANLLYINNYVSTDHLCMFQSWYLSVDTQLFVLAPIIVFPLWYKRILGEIILAILCIATCIIPFMITCAQQLEPTLIFFPEKFVELNDLGSNFYFVNYYVKTHMRANAYIMGMIFGYVVHKIQLESTKIPFIARVLIGILAVVASAGAMFSIVIFYQDDYTYNPSESGLYASLHRVAWCFGIGWTLLVCVTSNSYVNNFLSWKAWGPFSKLTYCAYLVNGIVELYSYGQTRIPRYLSIYSFCSEIAAHIVMTLLAAFFLCVLFESPIHNIEKLLLKKTNCKQSSKISATIRETNDTDISFPSSNIIRTTN